MNGLLWVLQVVLGVYFVATGVIHFVVPPGLPDAMSWMYELSPTLHVLSGAAEVLGGLGLVLPRLTGIRPGLTPWAAVGLALVMVGAAVWHLQRGEAANIGINVVMLVLVGFVAYGRWKLRP